VDAYLTLDEAVVRYLCEKCGVIMKDVNYEHVRRLEYRLFCAASYGERLYGMVDELKRELAIVEAERGRLAVFFCWSLHNSVQCRQDGHNQLC
jgi:hypothetical protein